MEAHSLPQFPHRPSCLPRRLQQGPETFSRRCCSVGDSPHIVRRWNRLCCPAGGRDYPAFKYWLGWYIFLKYVEDDTEVSCGEWILLVTRIPRIVAPLGR